MTGLSKVYFVEDSYTSEYLIIYDVFIHTYCTTEYSMYILYTVHIYKYRLVFRPSRGRFVFVRGLWRPFRGWGWPWNASAECSLYQNSMCRIKNKQTPFLYSCKAVPPYLSSDSCGEIGFNQHQHGHGHGHGHPLPQEEIKPLLVARLVISGTFLVVVLLDGWMVSLVLEEEEEVESSLSLHMTSDCAFNKVCSA